MTDRPAATGATDALHPDLLPPHQGEGERVGIDDIRAFTPQLHRAEWPNGFSPKGIKTYDGDRNPEAWLRST